MIIIYILGFTESNEKAEHIRQKMSRICPNITLLLAKNPTEDKQVAVYKLAFMANSNHQIEHFCQNLINFIYLKNSFLIPVNFKTKVFQLFFILYLIFLFSTTKKEIIRKYKNNPENANGLLNEEKLSFLQVGIFIIINKHIFIEMYLKISFK